MIEQNDIHETCYPAEGRCDIALDLEEELLYAYSTHPVGAASLGNKTTLKSQQQDQEQQRTAETCYPAEGRCDLAADLAEEQHDAYSAHHTRVSS